MNEYYAATETAKGIKLKNKAVFEKDLDTLREMFGDRVLAGWEIDFHESEPFVFFNGDESATLKPECDEWGEEVNLLAFLQHHMTEDAPVAAIHGVSHEGYSTWSWTVAFTHDNEVWMSTDDVIEHLEEKFKESSR